MPDVSRLLLVTPPRGTIAIHVAGKEDWRKAEKARSKRLRRAAASQGFAAQPLSVLLVPGDDGGVSEVHVGAPADRNDIFALGALSAKLPEGTYQFAKPMERIDLVALAWCLEQYKYDPFRAITMKQVKLVVPRKVDVQLLARQIIAVSQVRDLVNAPANIMGPEALEKAAVTIAKAGRAKIKVIKGDALKKGFPLIQAVGAAGDEAPRLVDFTWGNLRHPKVTLVGKGVCFDTGGLDIKTSSSMLLMKKDMGGAATALGLASLIMQERLKLRLRVLIPIVENSISDEAMRPGDVYRSRKGLTVEIGNTDAEGRLILADALALADEEAPDLMIDMATLTGAARVALGPDLVPFYTDDDHLAHQLQSHGFAENDPVWRMPLWRAYNQMIETPIADLNNSGVGGFAGSITAALFLRRFVEKAKAHVHFDIFAWTPTPKPGRPKGAEAQAMRAVLALLRQRFGK
jgi:leucyl aminopeptidase